MKTLLGFLLLFSACAFAQTGVRVNPGPLTTTAVISGTTVIVPKAAVTIQFCNHPANATPCSNKATTYTDATLGTPCSTSAQVVLDGTTTCVAGSDSIGNWGVWVASANYDWTFTDSGGNSFGPYYVTANSSPNLNNWNSINNPTGNLTLAMGTNTTTFNYSLNAAVNAFTWGVVATPRIELRELNDGNNDFMLDFEPSGAGANSPIAFGFSGDVTTSQYRLAKGTAGTSALTLNTTADTAGKVVGICTTTCGVAGPQLIAVLGIAPCQFDGAPNVWDWVVVSSTINGDCHDTGSASTYPASGTVIGRVANSNFTYSGAYAVLLNIER